MSKGIEVLAKPPAGGEAILSGQALGFVERLHREFQPRRRELLDRRAKRQAEFDAGALPTFCRRPNPCGAAPGAYRYLE